MHQYDKTTRTQLKNSTEQDGKLTSPLSSTLPRFRFYSATLLVVKFKMTDSNEEVFGLLFLTHTGYVFTAVLWIKYLAL